MLRRDRRRISGGPSLRPTAPPARPLRRRRDRTCRGVGAFGGSGGSPPPPSRPQRRDGAPSPRRSCRCLRRRHCPRRPSRASNPGGRHSRRRSPGTTPHPATSPCCRRSPPRGRPRWVSTPPITVTCCSGIMVRPSFEHKRRVGAPPAGTTDSALTVLESKAPDLFEWGQHPGLDGDVGCEVGDRLGSHAPCPLRCGSLIACRAGRRPLRRGSIEA